MWTFTLPHIGNEEVFWATAMAVSFSKLEEFDTANGDDWVQYIERMEHYVLPGEWNYRRVEATLNSYQFYGTKGIKDSQEHCRSQQTDWCQQSAKVLIY